MMDKTMYIIDDPWTQLNKTFPSRLEVTSAMLGHTEEVNHTEDASIYEHIFKSNLLQSESWSLVQDTMTTRLAAKELEQVTKQVIEAFGVTPSVLGTPSDYMGTTTCGIPPHPWSIEDTIEIVERFQKQFPIPPDPTILLTEEAYKALCKVLCLQKLAKAYPPLRGKIRKCKARRRQAALAKKRTRLLKREAVRYAHDKASMFVGMRRLKLGWSQELPYSL